MSTKGYFVARVACGVMVGLDSRMPLSFAVGRVVWLALHNYSNVPSAF
ncbi:MAG: hypothetical protein PHV61_05570 [Limnochordia bacterium]|nr:hypothetical protein [Limnochordia bacterium]MDD4519240.1 hypothetical protein [Limnochordia bacterium]